MPGAMPFLHRWWGNPAFFSLMVQRISWSPGFTTFTVGYEALPGNCTIVWTSVAPEWSSRPK